MHGKCVSAPFPLVVRLAIDGRSLNSPCWLNFRTKYQVISENALTEIELENPEQREKKLAHHSRYQPFPNVFNRNDALAAIGCVYTHQTMYL